MRGNGLVYIPDHGGFLNPSHAEAASALRCGELPPGWSLGPPMTFQVDAGGACGGCVKGELATSGLVSVLRDALVEACDLLHARVTVAGDGQYAAVERLRRLVEVAP